MAFSATGAADPSVMNQLLDVVVAAFLGEDLPPVLVRAASSGRHQPLRTLLRRFADKLGSRPPPKSLRRQLGEALRAAAEAGHRLCCEALLESCVRMAGCVDQVLRSTDSRRWNAVMIAAFYKREDCLRLLLAWCGGLSRVLDQEDHERKTALALAAEQGHPGCLQLLLESTPANAFTQKHLDLALQCAARPMLDGITWVLQHTTIQASAPGLPCRWRCMELLLARGAQLPRGFSQSEGLAVQAVVQQMAHDALVAAKAAEGRGSSRC